jgi:hypothetical protein
MLAGAASQKAVCLIKSGVHRIALLENTAKSKNRQSAISRAAVSELWRRGAFEQQVFIRLRH